jgi:hypothetical protein
LRKEETGMSESCNILEGDWTILWGDGYFGAIRKVVFVRSQGIDEAYDLQWSDAGGTTYKFSQIACVQGMLSDRCDAYKQVGSEWASVGVYDVYVQIDTSIPYIQGLCEVVTAAPASSGSGTEDPLAGSWGAETHGTGPTHGGDDEHPRGHGRRN